MKLPVTFKKPQFIETVPLKINQHIRDKAIDRAKTRIAVAGSDPKKMSQMDLEILVKEEEDQIRGSIKEKGILAVLALLGINLLG